MSRFSITRPTCLPLVAVAFLLGAGTALADGVNTSDLSQLVPAERGIDLAFPAIFGAASAIPAPGGTGYVALTYATPRNGIKGNGGDGDLVAGYTIGNPVDAISLSFGVAITGLDPFGDSGSFSVTASRMITASDHSATFLGASVLGIGSWGDARADGEAVNVFASHLTSLPMDGMDIPVQLTVGYGTRTTLDNDGSGRVDNGPFYGIGIGVFEPLAISLSGTTSQLNLGAVLYIREIEGLSVVAGVFDVFDNTDRQQATLTVAYAF